MLVRLTLIFVDVITVELPIRLECSSALLYPDGDFLVCPEGASEWCATETNSILGEDVKNAHSILLQNGDTISVIKYFNVKDSSSAVKVGTKVKNICLVDDDHDTDCRMDNVGAIKLKSEFVEKSDV